MFHRPHRAVRRRLLQTLALGFPAVCLLTGPARAATASSMGAIEAIKTRRSVRRYKPDPVSDELLQEVLSCGMQAPSACNEQPWRIVVIRDRDLLSKAGGINPYAKFAAEAPLALLVCGDKRLEKCEGYWVQDCSNCSMNMLLAAHALGLGAVWTGIYPLPDRVEGFQKLCGLPKEVIPLSLLVMGWPAITPDPEKRFNPERVHQNHW